LLEIPSGCRPRAYNRRVAVGLSLPEQVGPNNYTAKSFSCGYFSIVEPFFRP